MSGIYRGPDGRQLHGDGRPVGKPASELPAPANNQFKLTSAEEWVSDFINNKNISSQDHVRKIQLEAIRYGMRLAADIAYASRNLECGKDNILTATKEFKL